MPFSEKNQTVLSKTNEDLLTKIGEKYQAGIKVHQPGEIIPKHVNYIEGVSPHLVESVTSYLKGPTITDEFGAQHELRRAFFEKMRVEDPQIFAWMETNRLRFNNMFGLSMLGLFNQNGIIEKSLLDELHYVLPKSAEEFTALGTEEAKVQKTEEVAAVVRKIYESLLVDG